MVLIGRLTKDAVVTTLKDDRKVVNFTLAVNDSYKPKGSDTWKQNTTFFTCAYWLTPSIATRLKKGSLIELTGRTYATAYTDMQGEAKASLHCHVDSIKVHQQQKGIADAASMPAPKPATDDLPF
ncbi:MAG: single-stranded DNA-binding protein [Bacteroidetes bacterium]|nr:single-stranded DNA-binding protein [Bacteroidota bacterium]